MPARPHVACFYNDPQRSCRRWYRRPYRSLCSVCSIQGTFKVCLPSHCTTRCMCTWVATSWTDYTVKKVTMCSIEHAGQWFKLTLPVINKRTKCEYEKIKTWHFLWISLNASVYCLSFSCIPPNCLQFSTNVHLVSRMKDSRSEVKGHCDQHPYLTNCRHTNYHFVVICQSQCDFKFGGSNSLFPIKQVLWFTYWHFACVSFCSLFPSVSDRFIFLSSLLFDVSWHGVDVSHIALKCVWYIMYLYQWVWKTCLHFGSSLSSSILSFHHSKSCHLFA